MTAARTINFKLNGAPVTADVKPHHNWSRCCNRSSG